MRLNHALIRTTNLAAMSQFLTSGIGLEQGDRPPFPFQGAWFYSDNKPLVHVATGGRFIGGGGPIDHLAIEGANYEELMARLSDQALRFDEAVVPESGARQVFVYGPDGLRVEMMFPKAA